MCTKFTLFLAKLLKMVLKLAAVICGFCTTVMTYRRLMLAKGSVVSIGTKPEPNTWKPSFWHAKRSSLSNSSGSCFSTRKSKPAHMPPSSKVHCDTVAICMSCLPAVRGAKMRCSCPGSRVRALTVTLKRLPGGTTATRASAATSWKERRFLRARTSEPLKPSKYKVIVKSFNLLELKYTLGPKVSVASLALAALKSETSSPMRMTLR
mmetsp:Transcript_12945/g.35188  ORF Transcript_12945/g.35188 Transcript_12945/m.35188 type:complete len:208 (+) Transcript_12945:972-1595(+)